LSRRIDLGIRKWVEWIGIVSERRLHVSLFFVMVTGFLWPATAMAQNPPSPLVTQSVDESKTVTLHGTVHPLAQARYDQGVVPDSFAANRMLLMLNRSPQREAALRQFMSEVHTKGSATYHQWVTPEQFGERFGPADSDILAATSWLASHGFQVARVTKGKSLIEFSGTAANVREAFHTQIHQYSVNGETHYANASELSVPAALAPLVRGVSPINNFYPQPYLQSVGSARYSHGSRITTLFTGANGGSEEFAIAPEDFATQYDLGPLYNAGINGTGQTIGIISQSNIDLTLPAAYRALFNLAPNPPQVVIDGDDPGVSAGVVEPYLDVELSGAVAPNATINLYIADGSDVEAPAQLAALRAIEDNQASVLSASLGECEEALGNGGNAIWSGLWEQAAAQGQTVFVSAGDHGPAECPNGIISGGVLTEPGPGVNGIASTLWNIAVGGTDFFYADYASGAPSAPTFWNTTNDANLGSLKGPLPEQPWDNALGLNPLGLLVTGVSIPSAAGGGGPSSCASIQTTDSGISCVSGNPKPSWQVGAGVPNDFVRDIPDVSLFAANGKNFSSYAVCAQPGDCSGGGADSTVYLVGGTSASSPAMAGIMALVDQKYGRQGQANFTLYKLAAQQPSVFHDITIGTNDILCITTTPGCTVPVPSGIFPGLTSFGIYAAGPGYDLATGLGSVDANALVANWNKISFLPSTTTLMLEPATQVHGRSVVFNVNVTGGPGLQLPRGDVDISTTSPIPLPETSAVPVSAGSAIESVDFFPGGTYEVTAQYTGDGFFAPSASQPMMLTITPEASTVTPVVHFNGGDVISGQQVPFGSQWTFEAAPSSVANGTSGQATGTVTFTDGTLSAEVAIGSSGIGAVNIPNLAVGAHSVTVSYSGDASFNASTGGPLAFSVVPGIPRITITPNISQLIENGGPVPIPAGSNLNIGVLVGSNFGVAPTGNINITLGATTQIAELAPIVLEGRVLATAQTTFTNLQPGTFTLSAFYGGDGNWSAISGASLNPITVANVTVVPTTTTLTATPATVTSQGNVTLTATVQGGAGAQSAPFGSVFFYVDGVSLAATFMQSSGGTSSTATMVVPGVNFPNGAHQITAVFPGFNGTFGPSTSAPVTVTANLGAFTLALTAGTVVVPTGQSGTVTLLLNGQNGFNGPLPLSCAPSSNSIGCSTNPATPMVSGNTTATVTVNAFILQQGVAASAPPMDRSRRMPPGVLIASAVLMLLALYNSIYRTPRRISRRLRWALGSLALELLLLINGCGGGSSPPPPPPPPQKVNAPPGTYSAVITASAGGVIHNIKLTVVVQ
jgi:hypothetical protein